MIRYYKDIMGKKGKPTVRKARNFFWKNKQKKLKKKDLNAKIDWFWQKHLQLVDVPNCNTPRPSGDPIPSPKCAVVTYTYE